MKFIWEAKNISLSSWLIQFIATTYHCEDCLHVCNSLLFCRHQFLLQKLQYDQNAASRLLTYLNKYDLISPILKELHWLPVMSRIEFKILILTFKAYHEIGPK